MLLSDPSAMHTADTTRDTRLDTDVQHRVTLPIVTETLEIATEPQTSRSSTNSPISQNTAAESSTSQFTHTDGRVQNRDLTPPSSIDSSQEQLVIECRGLEAISVAGKKRTANGEIKYQSSDLQQPLSHSKDDIKALQSGDVSELSKSLKMRLSYAMLKVQHGWQDRSLEEIESLTSHSPRSIVSGRGQTDQTLVSSPRVAFAAKLPSTFGDENTTPALQALMPAPVRSANRILAPSASFTSGHRRRSTMNGGLYIDVKQSPPTTRPAVRQRTASQNAAMEADAVETLLFMSASPNNSGRFPSTFSPISQTFSAQTSPLRGRFSPRHQRPLEDQETIVERLLCDLDDDTTDELNTAVQIMERHRASKLIV